MEDLIYTFKCQIDDLPLLSNQDLLEIALEELGMDNGTYLSAVIDMTDDPDFVDVSVKMNIRD